MILQSLAGLPAFLVHFCTAIVAVVAHLFVYTRVAPHDEFQLIRDSNPAAAIALGLSVLGFVLPERGRPAADERARAEMVQRVPISAEIAVTFNG